MFRLNLPRELLPPQPSVVEHGVDWVHFPRQAEDLLVLSADLTSRATVVWKPLSEKLLEARPQLYRRRFCDQAFVGRRIFRHWKMEMSKGDKTTTIVWTRRMYDDEIYPIDTFSKNSSWDFQTRWTTKKDFTHSLLFYTALEFRLLNIILNTQKLFEQYYHLLRSFHDCLDPVITLTS